MSRALQLIGARQTPETLAAMKGSSRQFTRPLWLSPTTESRRCEAEGETTRTGPDWGAGRMWGSPARRARVPIALFTPMHAQRTGAAGAHKPSPREWDFSRTESPSVVSHRVLLALADAFALGLAGHSTDLAPAAACDTRTTPPLAALWPPTRFCTFPRPRRPL